MNLTKKNFVEPAILKDHEFNPRVKDGRSKKRLKPNAESPWPPFLRKLEVGDCFVFSSHCRFSILRHGRLLGIEMDYCWNLRKTSVCLYCRRA